MTDANGRNRPGLPLQGTVDGDGNIRLPDGTVLDLSGGHPPPNTSPVNAEYLQQVVPYEFERCPICDSPPPLTKEHVPPLSVGGGPGHLTLTCEACNNRLGSALEALLADHVSATVRGPGFTADAVPGRRRARGVSVRFQDDGKFVMLVDNPDPAVRDMLQSGGFDMSWSSPGEPVWRTALLKHAYLVACVYLRQVPDTPHTSAVRSELLRSRRDPGKVGPIARQLRLVRITGTPPWPVSIAAADIDGDGSAKAMVGLGRYGLVPWPMPDTSGLLIDGLNRAR